MPEKKSGEKKPGWYDNYTTYIKDAIYIIGIIIALYGWISTKAKNETTLETTVKYSTEAIERIEMLMDKQIELNAKQAELDGQYSQFINSHTQ
jgi:hypothetical protein